MLSVHKTSLLITKINYNVFFNLSKKYCYFVLLYNTNRNMK